MTIPDFQAKVSRSPGIAVLSLSLFCVVVSAVFPTVSSSQHGHHTTENSAPGVGAPAVPFDLKTLDGKSVGLASFRGKPLIMNFFASWCDPCREEMPLINELAAKSNKGDYSVLGIAVEDGRAAVTEYVKEVKLIFPIALDLNSTVKRSYRIFGPPATFFIDGQGILRDVVLGPISPERARAAMKKLGLEVR
jgi:cytochrome c biogenesis protein CcmG/thiol:disulfide interchange protein DsbE